MDEETRCKSRLDVGRILITVSSPKAVNRIGKMKVNEHVFSVRLVEEVFVDQCCKVRISGKVISECGCSSDYSDAVENSLLGMPGSDEDEDLRTGFVQRQKTLVLNSNPACQSGNSGLAEQGVRLDSGSAACPKVSYDGALNAFCFPPLQPGVSTG